MKSKALHIYKKKEAQKKEWKQYGLRLLIVIGALSVVAIIFDKIAMPYYVGLNDTVIVPNVTNLDLMEATKVLESNGFFIGISGSHYNEKFPKNHIVSQLPNAGSDAKRNRRVYVVLSLGVEKIKMPRLLGRKIRDSRLELMRLGLTLDSVHYTFMDSIDAHYVYGQSIQPGEKIERDRLITLSVSRGPEIVYVTVPTIIGMNEIEARKALAFADLAWGRVWYDISETFQPGTVIEQFPAAGASVESGTPVNVSISSHFDL